MLKKQDSIRFIRICSIYDTCTILYLINNFKIYKYVCSSDKKVFLLSVHKDMSLNPLMARTTLFISKHIYVENSDN